MTRVKPLKKDDSGSSLLMEYIFTIIIAALLFSVLLLTLQSIITRSNQVLMSQETDLAASIVANQLSDYSNDIWLNTYGNGVVSLTEAGAGAKYFNLSKPDSGKQYSVKVAHDPGFSGRGIVTVTYLADPTVYSTYTFNSPIPVEDKLLYCNTYHLKVSYESPDYPPAGHSPVSQPGILRLEEV